METTAPGSAMAQLQTIDVGKLKPRPSAELAAPPEEPPPMLPSGRHPVAPPTQPSASRQQADLGAGVAGELSEARAALQSAEAEMQALRDQQEAEFATLVQAQAAELHELQETVTG